MLETRSKIALSQAFNTSVLLLQNYGMHVHSVIDFPAISLLTEKNSVCWKKEMTVINKKQTDD